MKNDRMVSNSICLQSMLLLILVARIVAFVPPMRNALGSVHTAPLASYRERPRDLSYRSVVWLKASGDNKETGDDDDDPNKMVSDFFFDMNKNNLDPRSSMDAGIFEMLGAKGGSGIKSTAGETSDGKSSGETPVSKESESSDGGASGATKGSEEK